MEEFYRRKLPHIQPQGATFFVTFRLAGSLPDAVIELLKADPRILKDPEPFVALGALADSSVNITTRAWVNAADYWGVYFDMQQKYYKGAGAKGINIPFPQLDVHLSK